MKKLLLTLTIASLVVFTSCKENAAEKINQENVTKAAERDSKAIVFPSISFDKTEHDFGQIMNGTPVETTFSYTNTGESPLVVTDIKSTCGCTVPQGWSKEPLMPGASSQFSVKFNGKGANKTSKTITLTTNTQTGREQVRISAFITPDPNAPVVKKQ
jgi:hypothetical protein|tara:strand:+ start:709 stop:1182 length:474 start_codon:yes stop_codon:yes gene_type:complete